MSSSTAKGLNKKHIYCYLNCIVYDKLLKPRQSFRITLYNEQSADQEIPGHFMESTGLTPVLTKSRHWPLSCIHLTFRRLTTTIGAVPHL